jgi:alkanesulfonate monooxygenase SsuD/methylene tetrahydromethanopterin reductase-like flavin-dependent oxidoreductase (luciferase family)
MSETSSRGPRMSVVIPNYNHPARVAERVAALDLVSEGRAEFGTGESSTFAELDAFHVSRTEKRAADPPSRRKSRVNAACNGLARARRFRAVHGRGRRLDGDMVGRDPLTPRNSRRPALSSPTARR